MRCEELELGTRILLVEDEDTLRTIISQVVNLKLDLRISQHEQGLS